VRNVPNDADGAGGDHQLLAGRVGQSATVNSVLDAERGRFESPDQKPMAGGFAKRAHRSVEKDSAVVMGKLSKVSSAISGMDQGCLITGYLSDCFDSFTI